MNFTKLLFSILIALLSSVSFSQVQMNWVRHYDGFSKHDLAYSITNDNAGNVYVTGYSIGATTSYDFITIKYNAAGDVLWTARYNGPANRQDAAFAIAVDNSGNVYVTGRSSGVNSYDDFATVKYNSSGIQQWVQRYNGPANFVDAGNLITLDNNGNIYVAGYSYGTISSSDYAIIKYNPAGILLWSTRYNGTGNAADEITSLSVDNEGNVFITGGSMGNATGNDFVTIKYNSTGTEQWEQRYNSSGNNENKAASLSIDNSGNVYVTGYSYNAQTNYDFTTIKYSSNGAQMWVQNYNGTGNGSDFAKCIKTDNLNNIYITGSSTGTGGNYDYTTIRYSTAGQLNLVTRYSVSQNSIDIPEKLVVDNFNNVYVTGTSYSAATAPVFLTICYSFDGSTSWTQTYKRSENSNNGALSLAVDNLKNVYVTGFSSLNDTNIDYTTIKYSQSIGITPISGEVPQSFSLSQNYPNPFNPVTNINFQLPKSGFVKLVVYDILGNETETLVSQNLNSGSYKVNWNAAKYPSGIYYYKISAGDFTETKKMVLIK